MSSLEATSSLPPGRTTLIRIAGALGASAVILGALGAHGSVADHLLARGNGADETWRTAVLYHLVHSVVILVWAMRPSSIRTSAPALLILVGILCFSGSLYLLAAFGFNWLGPITPLGGLFLIAGWLGIGLSKGTQNSD